MTKKRETLIYNLAESLNRLSRTKWFLGDSELSVDDFFILNLINEEGKCSMKDIVTGFSIPASTATGIVDRLVKKNYIHRGQSNVDRRVVSVEVTPEGKKAHDTFRTTSLGRMAESVDLLTDDEVEMLIRLIDKLVSNLAG
jgi:DNA-binding MarR family transcriptional regulator